MELDRFIAVVGMAGRFPGAPDIAGFWQLICEGREGISLFSREELLASGLSAKIVDAPDYVGSHGVIRDVELFDTDFFEMTPAEAELTDPQHRVFLEVCHEALENSGYRPDLFPGLIGVYGSASINTYLQKHILANVDQTSTSRLFEVMVGNDKDYLATRVSYKLDLKGPAFTVQTACSSSLVAIHSACQALMNGECDLAIAGGVTIKLPQVTGYFFEEGSILSADGHTRTFDADASGVVLGNGAGAVILKRLDEAQADRDTIHAVIRATAINNDGSNKVSFAAPGKEGQAAVIAEAHAVAEAEPESITYVEAHGTGTRLGDPIEVNALTQAFRRGTRKTEYCSIGSIKANIGHLDAAAGVAGLIKTSLMLRNRTLVPSVNFARPNPAIPFSETPFFVNTALRPWEAAGPLRAGVSSFGIGGTNAHAILEEPPPAPSTGPSRPVHVVTLSAKTATALEAASGRLAGHLERQPEADLADVAYTLAVGRRAFRHRRVVVCRSADEAVEGLRAGGGPDGGTARCPAAPPPVAVAFAAYVDACEERVERLSGREPSFKKHIDACRDGGVRTDTSDGAAFAYQVALANLWKGWGLVAEEVWGEGVGEIAAAHVAGDIALADAVAALAEPGSRPAVRVRPEAGPPDGAVVLEPGEHDPYAAVALAWLAGVEVDWAQYYAHERRGRIPLPTYPFEGRRCWLPERPVPVVDGKAAPGAPATGAPAAGDGADAAIVLDIGREPVSADHLLDGTAIAPAAAFMDWALRAGERSTGRQLGVLRALAFERRLPFAGASQQVRVIFAPGQADLPFELYGDDGEAALVRGTLGRDDPQPRTETVDIASIEARCPTRLTGDDGYDLLAGTGLVYGPRLRSLRGLSCNAREAVAYLEVPATTDAAAAYRLHPALIDGALQGAAAFLAHRSRSARADYLPYSVAEVVAYRPLPRRCACHIAVTDGRIGGSLVKLDLTLVDEGGRVVAELRELAVRARPAEDRSPAVGVYGARWTPIEPAAAGLPEDGVVVFCGDPDEADRLGAVAGGAPVVAVTPGDRFAVLSPRHVVVDPGRPEDLDRLLDVLAERGGRAMTLLYCWSALDGAGDDLDRGIGSLFVLTKSLLRKRLQDRTRIVYAYALDAHGARPADAAVGGFARSLRLEAPDVRLQAIGIEAAGTADIAKRAYETMACSALDIREDGGGPCGRRFERVEPGDGTAWRPQGVQLVTGGTGRLGLTLARHLAEKGAERVVLVGRADAAEAEARIVDAQLPEGVVVYRRADVADAVQVADLVERVREDVGPIRGVFHLAGVLRDSYLATKSLEDLNDVVAPKLQAAEALDRATADDPLERFVLFSSIAAAFGSEGQTDYAFANAGLDALAERRERQVAAGRRPGRTVSIGWPLWAEGGMRQDDEAAERLYGRTGLRAMPTADGLAALDVALADGGHVIVGYGDLERFAAAQHTAPFHLEPPPVETGLFETGPADTAAGGRDPDPASAAASSSSVAEDAVELLCGLFAEVTKLGREEVDPDALLESYAVDSLVITKLNRQLETYFDRLSKTLFFEYATLREIADHLAANHADGVPRRGAEPEAAADPTPPAQDRPAHGPAAGTPGDEAAARSDPAAIAEAVARDGPRAKTVAEADADAIAVVGLAGRYPQADTLDAFWDNLHDGRDCIVEIPPSRWDHDRYFDAQAGTPGRAYARWGGFLDDIDAFDPLFFGISPRTAELMDPQERLFLQTAWHTVESAGYARADLAQRAVGVFVGVMYGEYQLYSADLPDARPVTGSSFATIANRVSYTLNLTGPSLALDTMCSSSLTAIHLACESLRRGESDMAIAGGVNLSLHPYKYVFLSQGRYLSTDGKCRSFGADGTGYVPGEGVGAVLLKPLPAAIADGDYIHGVIRGTAINHSGRTHGFTVPSPRAQAGVLGAALARAGLDAGDVDYVETHGTGTSLGDPIEITALSQVYGKTNGHDAAPIPLGSVKSNVGHLESAAGIAGLTKVLLQFRHRTLVPSLHSEVPNPNIDFDALPFAVQQERAPWRTRTRNGHGGQAPLRAGVSSFGAGGTNAHMVVEAYDHNVASDRPAGRQTTPAPVAVVLSARDEDALRRYADRLADELAVRQVPLADLAYTLQVGRDVGSARLAVIERDGAALTDTLRTFAGGDDPPAVLRQADAVAEDGGPLRACVREWLASGKTDWSRLYAGADAPRPRRTPGPLYPFAGERYWLPDAPARAGEPFATAAAPKALHPLLDANESTLHEVRFKRTLRVEEPLISDHVIEGRALLAGAALLEMARAAAVRAGCDPASAIAEVVWLQPVDVTGEARDVVLALAAEPGGAAFTLASDRDGERAVHAKGRVRPIGAATGDGTVDIEAVQRRLPRHRSGDAVQDAYRRAGFAYGESFDVIEAVWSGPDEALVKLRQATAEADVTLPPVLLDGVLRACHWIGRLDEDVAGRFAVPLSLGEIVVHGPVPAACFAHARRSGSGNETFDISVLDESGREVAAISRFVGRVLSRDRGGDRAEPVLFAPTWVDEALPPSSSFADALVVLDGAANDAADRAAALGAAGQWPRVLTVTPAAGSGRVGPDHAAVDPREPADYRRFFDRLRDAGVRSIDLACLWTLDPPAEAGGGAADLRARLDLGIYSVRALVAAAVEAGWMGRLRCLYAHGETDEGPHPEFEAIAGFALSVAGPAPQVTLATVCLAGLDRVRAAGVVAEELARLPRRSGLEIRRTASDRQVRRLVRAVPAGLPPLIQAGGRYLVTGARGAIGAILSDYLAQRYGARLVLVGRSAMPEADLERLRASGAEVLAVQADVADRDGIASAVAAAQDRFGGLDGVFHLAGVAEPPDAGLSDAAAFDRVLGPKLHGLIALDDATRHQRLDFFVAFSSIASLIGDFGNCSYATANRFADAFMTSRQARVRSGQCHGRSLSLAWPLWEGPGMNTLLGDRELAAYASKTGMRPLGPEAALAALEAASRYDRACLLPTAATADEDVARIDRALAAILPAAPGPAADAAPAAPAAPGSPETAGGPVDAVSGFLVETIARVLKIAPGQIDHRVALADYGLDSVMVMETIDLLGKDVPELRSTALFEYPSIAELAGHIVAEHAAAAAGLAARRSSAGDAAHEARTEARQAAAPEGTVAPIAAETSRIPADPDPEPQPDGIAVIGMGGYYPDAETVEEFWANLLAGRDSVTEVPPERWDVDALFDPDPDAAGHSYGRWGAFLGNVDRFDSLFFQISPAQAKLMDPQERLFLEAAWSALEDAGYPPSRLPRPRFAEGGRDVGVFVGVMWDDYAFLAADQAANGNHPVVLANRSGIANQLSYFCDFRGPSLVIDTACSASLIALHQACESLRRGESAYAIAGGVNVSAHPLKYVHLSRKKMLSQDGRCRSFGAEGSGYVPGEGVGAVLLKPLSQAVADGDNIRAVIRATAANHGGKTSGYTVPNPHAQQAVVEAALARSGVDPRSIGYVEAHGTGTALGDPIEHTGLSLAFAKHTEDRGFCALGSVKSNIGHLEGAAGIAGVTKAVLQLERGQIVASLHADTLNPLIDFAGSPFFVAREPRSWPRTGQQPRRAAVSSFGAGGANAHVILEEHPRPARPEDGRPALLVLSARNAERLRAYAGRMADHLAGPGRDLAVADVAFTLQLGREAFGARLAFTASSTHEAAERFAAIARDGVRHAWCFSNADGAGAGAEAGAAARPGGAAADLERLAALWTAGEAVEWSDLYAPGDRDGIRVSLPAYPFERARHWLARRGASAGRPAGAATTAPAAPRLSLPGAAPVLRDHVIDGQPILPGAAQLDFVLGALGVPGELTDVAFVAPVVADAGGVALDLIAEADGAYELRSARDAGKTVHSSGVYRPIDSADKATIALNVIRARCARSTDTARLYDMLAAQGLAYGPYFRCVEDLHSGRREAVARLRLPDGERPSRALHPALLDAAFHAVAELNRDLGRTKPCLPFAVERMTVFKPLPASGWAHVECRGTDLFDVVVADDDGQVCLSLQGLLFREAPSVRHALPLYAPGWTPMPRPADGAVAPAPAGVLFVGGEADDALADAILRAHGDVPAARVPVGPDGASEADVDRALAAVPAPDLVYVAAVRDGRAAPSSLDELRRGQERWFRTLSAVVKRLDRADALSKPCNVKLVTSGVFPLGRHEPHEPWAAGLIGFGAVLAKEYPQVRIAAIDLRDADGLDDVPAIVAEPCRAALEPVSIRAGVRRARRLARVETAPAAPRFRHGGTYLLVGGFGAIGRDLCLYLARRYAARLVVVGRSPEDRHERTIAAIADAGGEVHYVRCDVTDADGLRAAVGDVTARIGEVDGVVHTAMTLVDTRIVDLTWDDFRAASSAKVDALWNLFDVLRDRPLDFFLLFSSGSSFDGNKGQAGYVAGCTFADAFAARAAREAAFPVHVVNWGYWHGEDSDRQDFLKRLETAGIRPIGAEEGMAAMERVVSAGLPQVLATKTDVHLLEGIGVDPGAVARVAADPLPDLASAVAGPQVRATGDRSRAIARHLEGCGALDAWLAHGLLGVCRRMGAWQHAGERHHRDALARRLAVVPAMDGQWTWMLDVLVSAGVLAERGAGRELVVSRETHGGDLPDLVARFPSLGPVADVLGRVLDALPAVLTGERDPIDVLLPGGSTELLQPLYTDDPVMALCNEQVAAGLRTYVEERRRLDPEARVRIVEIGAGAGATTASVLRALEDIGGHVDYVYTDVSGQFVRHGRRQFAEDFPFVRFAALDIERDPADQGFEPGGFDVVLGANVFHATRRIHETVARAKRLLRRNGLIVLNEGTTVLRSFEAIFGLTAGWTAYEDPEHRLAGSPLLGVDAWLDVLADCGFPQASVWQPAPDGGPRAHQSVLIAGSDGIVAAGRAAAPAPSAPAPAVSAPAPSADGSRRTARNNGTASPASTPASTNDSVERLVICVFSAVLEMPEADIDPQASFETYGIDSLVALELSKRLSEDFGRLPVGLLFEHASIASLAAHLAERYGAPASTAASTPVPEPEPEPEPPPVPRPVSRPAPAAAPTRAASGGNGAHPPAAAGPAWPIDADDEKDPFARMVAGLSDADVERLFEHFSAVVTEQR